MTSDRSGTIADAFAERTARAEVLASRTGSAHEPLRFVAGLFRVQEESAAALEAVHRERPLVGGLSHDGARVLAPLIEVPRFIAALGPGRLAQEAHERAEEDAEHACARLALYWQGDRTTADDPLSRAMLRPYVEFLRLHGITPDRTHARGRCPFCGGAPSVGCRRSAGESDGGMRFLVCALCGLDWKFDRIRCAACFEADPQKLPTFHDVTRPGVRLETCETCRRYVKSIDLSPDPRALPEVDDLDSLALDLWALENGFTRLEPGLAGI